MTHKEYGGLELIRDLGACRDSLVYIERFRGRPMREVYEHLRGDNDSPRAIAVRQRWCWARWFANHLRDGQFQTPPPWSTIEKSVERILTANAKSRGMKVRRVAK